MLGHRILICSGSSAPSANGRILAAAGFAVSCASTRQALHALRTQPELVLLDLDLTNSETFLLIHAIRYHTMVPIILLTGDCSEAHMIYAMDLGVDDCLKKPVRPRELVARLQAKLRRDVGEWPLSA